MQKNPFPGERGISGRIVATFARKNETILAVGEFNEVGQHTTDWPPSVRLVGFPERGIRGRREDLARLPYYF
jgi:hypothetical protein